MAQLNGIDVDELREYVASAARDAAVADRDPVVVARWAGGERAEVAFASGEAPVFVGGADEPSAMKMVLASLAACDVDLVANRAALLGVEIESLTVEATGHFNVSRYLGLDATAGSGYDRIAYTVRLKTRGGTPGQLAELRRACEQASPVGDTLQRHVDLSLRFEAS
jgi:uncharacterized OsmC-like protein